MSFLPFFDWCQNTALASAIRNSLWAAAVIDFFHLLGLAMLFGPVLIVNLRLMGFVLKTQPVGEVAAAVTPWWWRGLAVSAASGLLFFIANAVKVYGNPPFYLKMALLGVGITMQTTLVHTLAGRAEPGAFRAWATAVVSTLVWLVIPAAGYWIELD
jgi:hypothetical protein